MGRFKKLFLDKSLLIFLVIGVANTIISQLMQQLLLTPLGYWGATALAFFLTSILSFYLNRKYSFHSKGSLWGDALRFTINIAVCYLLAYGLAQPFARWFVGLFSAQWMQENVERISLLFGQVLFTGLNYFGQRFFAFKER